MSGAASHRPAWLVFVAGTTTGVGKTWWSAAMARHLRTAGIAVAARKPVQSGEAGEVSDADVLAAATGERVADVTPPHRTYELAWAPPMAAAELGRPALQGDRLAFHLIGRTSRIIVADLSTGQAATARQERRALLLNPSLQGRRLLYVRAHYARQELRLGPVTRRSPRKDRRLWSTVPTGYRDAGHEPGNEHKQHGHPHKMWKMGDGRLGPYEDTPLWRKLGPDCPRQILEPAYWSAGLVDVIRTETVERGSTIGEVVVPYLVDPEPCVDLDTDHDFIIAEAVLSLLRREGALCL